MRGKSKLAKFSKIYMFFIYLFLYAPLLVLIVFSFNESKSRVLWSGFTFKWYIKLFQDKEILMALFNTLLIATLSALLATVIGTAAAISISGMKKFTKRIVMNLTNLPMINPEIVTGVSLMLLFVFIYNTTGLLEPGILTLILAHTTFCLPYVILSVLPKLKQMNPHIYEAALDLGCRRSQAFFKVVLPDIMPGILSGMVMAFTLSLDDFVISYFTSGTTQTLPIAIYSMTRKIVSPEINALSTILFMSVLILLLFINMHKVKDLNISKIEKMGGKE